MERENEKREEIEILMEVDRINGKWKKRKKIDGSKIMKLMGKRKRIIEKELGKKKKNKVMIDMDVVRIERNGMKIEIKGRGKVVVGLRSEERKIREREG